MKEMKSKQHKWVNDNIMRMLWQSKRHYLCRIFFIHLLLRTLCTCTEALLLHLLLWLVCTWKPYLIPHHLKITYIPHLQLHRSPQGSRSTFSSTNCSKKGNHTSLVTNHKSINIFGIHKLLENMIHLVIHFPGVPPHHATTAWPLIIFPSTSSPCSSRLTTFGIPFPAQHFTVIF